jgi:DNA-binding transcriptional MerR regulator
MATQPTTYTVGQVARFAGLTVRTLHRYDEIGLLTPSSRRDNGYRVYDAADLERLRQILVYRELDMGLGDIAVVLDEPGEPADRLLEERQRVANKIRRLRAVADSIDGPIASHREGTTMDATEALEVFGDFDPTEHEDEARERWGDSDAYVQSAKRTASYTKENWETIKDDAAAIDQRFLGLMADGVPPNDPAAAKAVDDHRNHITKWFYECSADVHAGLGQMYVQDERFRTSINKAGNGSAEYLSAAIDARYAPESYS